MDSRTHVMGTVDAALRDVLEYSMQSEHVFADSSVGSQNIAELDGIETWQSEIVGSVERRLYRCGRGEDARGVKVGDGGLRHAALEECCLQLE
jgi:hypothetical protein